MSEVVILGVAIAAGLACPLHMWWSHRRGRQAACCPPTHATPGDGDLESLRARQERLQALIAPHDARQPEVLAETREAPE